MKYFRSASACQYSGFITQRGFDECINHCAYGFNPDNLQWIDESSGHNGLAQKGYSEEGFSEEGST